MSILRSREELALDGVVERCKAAADHYRSAQGATHDGDLAALFRDLERERRDFVAALESEIRRRGLLPSAPDADREALEHLATRIRAAVSADERRALIESGEEEEEKLAAAVDAALGENLEAGTLQLLRRLQVHGAQSQKRLAARKEA